MKGRYFFLVFMFLAGMLLGDEIIIETGGRIFVGTEVRFRFDPAPEMGVVLRWDFSDGRGESKPGGDNQHAFREPGTYRVTCEREGAGHPSSAAQVQVVVEDNRRVAPQGRNFRPGERVGFRGENFVDRTLRWDFGDGSIESG
ncbi:MAG: hypothetical protein JXO51_09750, partial [Candidatus Aminicenantes bacterium]|nr:hypothetical protein [Candidatus Aminicenantes bacterium]